MARQTERLTDLAVRRARRQGRYADGRGLYLQINQSGAKSWLFRFGRHGRERWAGLGPYPDIPLVEARQKALECRRTLLNGVDPIEAKRAARLTAKLEEARELSFKACAQRYIAAHEPSWRNPKHRAQWPSTLEHYAYPIFGHLPVGSIDTALILKAIEPIWTQKPETASRVRGRIEAVLDWASAREYRQGENPARWHGHLDKLLPPRARVRKVKHHAALPYDELPDFMAELGIDHRLEQRLVVANKCDVPRFYPGIGASLVAVSAIGKPAVFGQQDRFAEAIMGDRLLDGGWTVRWFSPGRDEQASAVAGTAADTLAVGQTTSHHTDRIQPVRYVDRDQRRHPIIGVVSRTMLIATGPA